MMCQEWLGYDPERGDIHGYTSEQMQEVLRALEEYMQECERCFNIAQKLDTCNPDICCAFAGTPSERIERQLKAQNVKGY